MSLPCSKPHAFPYWALPSLPSHNLCQGHIAKFRGFLRRALKRWGNLGGQCPNKKTATTWWVVLGLVDFFFFWGGQMNFFNLDILTFGDYFDQFFDKDPIIKKINQMLWDRFFFTAHLVP